MYEIEEVESHGVDETRLAELRRKELVEIPDLARGRALHAAAGKC